MAKGSSKKTVTAEQKRLNEDMPGPHVWRNWGTFLSERQWGTVREDYSADGDAWDYFTHDDARSRAYRWGEDGLLGWCDRFGHVIFSIALWNGNDPILKERLFGLTNTEGNHGEDVKELYYFLEATPTCSYCKALYKYPIQAFPYEDLVKTNHDRSRQEPEYELLDTGIFDHGWFDVTVEYARSTPSETGIRISITNRSENPAIIELLGQLYLRNTWSWELGDTRPQISMKDESCFVCPNEDFGSQYLHFSSKFEPLFTENETNTEKLFNSPNVSPYVKDAFHRYIINDETDAINPGHVGSKSAGRYSIALNPQETAVRHLLLTDKDDANFSPEIVDKLVATRKQESDQFYESFSAGLEPELSNIQRQAFAGLIWSKQQYHYDVKRWLKGDSGQPHPPLGRTRNIHWQHLRVSDVLSMPDTWEYPWFAAWDLAFQTVAFASIDPAFAKSQMVLLMREWYMNPSGQVPAYEWAFGDVNPPVHAWASWRIYTIDRRINGKSDRPFLERVFHKLLLSFTWWVNRKDEEGNNIFQGGFLGLDNIGVFNRDQVLPDGLTLDQSDGTSWMATFCLNMLTIALELAEEEPAYEDVAIKFFEHFLLIADAMNGMGGNTLSLWDPDDGFFYDAITYRSGGSKYLKVRSAVGLIPLFAVTVLDSDVAKKHPGFWRHVEWVFKNLPELTKNVTSMDDLGLASRRLLSIVDKDQLLKILSKVLDENEFLSEYGIRALSKYHKDHPFTLNIGGMNFTVDYEPGTSTSDQFGGNSNWRGPIWMPLCYLLIESLQQFHYFYGDDFSVELPSGSGNRVHLDRVAADLEQRLINMYLPDQKGNRPVHNNVQQYGKNGPWNDLVLFYEYFNGDDGSGLGAAHQTGWTSLLAKIIDQRYITAYSDMD